VSEVPITIHVIVKIIQNNENIISSFLYD
jgi:hypothetical protein